MSRFEDFKSVPVTGEESTSAAARFHAEAYAQPSAAKSTDADAIVQKVESALLRNDKNTHQDIWNAMSPFAIPARVAGDGDRLLNPDGIKVMEKAIDELNYLHDPRIGVEAYWDAEVKPTPGKHK